MKAAVLHNYGEPLKIQEVEIGKPLKGEVLLKVLSTGVCHSDLHVINGITPIPLPVVTGHEIMGVVEDVGEGVTSVVPGDVVVASFIWPCGKCSMCISGRENLCVKAASARMKGVLLDGTTRLRLSDGRPLHIFAGGGFAEYAIVPETALVKVPSAMQRRDSLAILGCAGLTGFGAVVNTAGIRLGDTVAVFGAGGVGMFVVQFSRIAGASQIIAVDIVDQKLAVAKSLGATHTINVREKDPVKEIKDLTGGEGVDVSFEVVGLSETITQAIESVKVGGKVVLVGLMPVGSTAPVHVARVVRAGIQILGSYGGRPRADLPIIFKLVSASLLEVDTLVSRKYKLDETNSAFEALERGEVLRSIVTP